jgi:hypothetical protein
MFCASWPTETGLRSCIVLVVALPIRFRGGKRRGTSTRWASAEQELDGVRLELIDRANKLNYADNRTCVPINGAQKLTGFCVFNYWNWIFILKCRCCPLIEQNI